MPVLLLPAARWSRWWSNFEQRHPGAALERRDAVWEGTAPDGARVRVTLPFGDPAVGPVPPSTVPGPSDWGVLLVRRGGFAVARVGGDRIVAHKIGQRHVQGRTKAGGQAQQRFARRRDNQARAAFEAAAEHAARILAGLQGPVVTGGDRPAVADVLGDARLRGLRPVERWLPVPDPRRAVLDAAVLDALALTVDVHDPVVRD
ncbi:acVLRF1 family peptidyl-tRNA hydrolase [Nocardioides sp.]|uniref:acVLRF1 family peptidyl-tRNA hydrolase n=1 Tax=Nocardioides sp. TaxID=35761 RepID=UPI003516C2A6